MAIVICPRLIEMLNDEALLLRSWQARETIVPLLILIPVNSVTLVRDGLPGALDVALSHSVMSAVSSGELGATLRLHIPTAMVAFGRSDRVAPGYAAAVRAAEAHGFTAVERLAGGRAAVFHESTIAFSLALPLADPRSGVEERFRMVAGSMAGAFEDLGMDARIGEIPGEYCPGRWSVSLGGRIKVMGVGQRLVRRAAHVGGVVVVDEARRIRDVLVPVYRALALDWDPRTAGALADRSPGLDSETVIQAIVRRFGRVFEMVDGSLPEAIVTRAEELLPGHLPEVA